jgi:hypothetical protein
MNAARFVSRLTRKPLELLLRLPPAAASQREAIFAVYALPHRGRRGGREVDRAAAPRARALAG